MMFLLRTSLTRFCSSEPETQCCTVELGEIRKRVLKIVIAEQEEVMKKSSQ